MVDAKLLMKFSEELSSSLKSYSQKNLFCVDITTTEACNFRCSYCFEGEKTFSKRTYELSEMTRFLDNILKNKRFQKEYKGLTLSFWGGEPTLEVEDILYYLDYYKERYDVFFFFYTNGTLRKNLDRIFEKCKENNLMDRIKIQISWDGDPVHDKNRIGLNPLHNSAYVKEQIKRYAKMGVEIDLKATLLPKDFSHLPEIWDSYNLLNEELGTDFMYAPTIDQAYYGSDYLDDLEKVLPLLCQRELKHIKKYGSPLFYWFGRSFKDCPYRRNMICFDVHGNIYPCHGFLYENDKIKEEEKLGSLQDVSFIENFLEDSSKYPPLKGENEECKTCEATYCVFCCVKTSTRSSKKTSYERWYDVKPSGKCFYYKLFGIYDKALHRILTRELI